jgi:DNA polymerase III delta prime subunit
MSQSPDGSSNTTEIHTEGGSYLAGNINIASGDFVGRDKIVIHRLDPADARNQRNHKALRHLVRSFWIDGVLKHSLYREVLIRLSMKEHPNAVDNRPWDLILQQPDQPNIAVSADIPILQVFDQVGQLLLILGEPGSGKTTILLELTDELLQRAENEATHPSPVVFNLSSWAEKRKSIAEWLVDELRTKFNIPKKVAQHWVEQDELLPLLDGLDEVQQAHREACVTAINQFRQEHMTPLAVCCRKAEYEKLTIRLKLQSAIVLQALSLDQINAYLAQASTDLVTLRSTIHQDAELQELATSPLLLNIMMLAYAGTSTEAVDSMPVSGNRRQQVFHAYIERMLVHRKKPSPYPLPQTLRWLCWLAIQLVNHGQAIFLIERLQPSWAQSPVHRFSAVPLVMRLWGPLYGMSYGLIIGLIIGLSGGLIGDPSNWLRYGLRYGLIIGLSVGLVSGLSGRYKITQSIEQSGLLWRRMRSSLYAFFFWTLIIGLGYGLSSGLRYGLRGGLIVGLSVGLVSGLSGGLLTIFRPRKLVAWPDLTAQKLKNNILFGLSDGLIVGLIVGLGYGLSGGLSSELIFRLIVGLSGGLSGGLIFKLIVGLSGGRIFELIVRLIVGLIFGLIGGLIGGLIFEPYTNNDVPTLKMTQIPNQSVQAAVKSSISIGLITGLVVWLVFGLSYGLIFELSGGLIDGLIVGLIVGLIGGLIGGGDIVVKHMILRFMLWKKGSIPWNYAQFLDYCTDRIFLRRVGGGYIFIHRLIMEHFAAMTDEDIEKFSNPISTKKQ